MALKDSHKTKMKRIERGIIPSDSDPAVPPVVIGKYNDISFFFFFNKGKTNLP
jgi:hypothetical protein